MNQDLMDQYVRAVVAARGLQRFCVMHSNLKGGGLYDTTLSQEDSWTFYRSLEYFVEIANEVCEGRHHAPTFFMNIIRTLEIIYIGDYWKPNAEGLDEFYHKHTNGTRIYPLTTDTLNAVHKVLLKRVCQDHELEPDVLMLCLQA